MERKSDAATIPPHTLLSRDSSYLWPFVLHDRRSCFGPSGCGAVHHRHSPLGGQTISYAHGVSGNGAVAAGSSLALGSAQAITWTSGGGSATTGVTAGYDSSQAYGISGDGTTVVGIATDSATSNSVAFRGVGGTMQALPILAGMDRGHGYAASADGTVVVGADYKADNGAVPGLQLVYWRRPPGTSTTRRRRRRRRRLCRQCRRQHRDRLFLHRSLRQRRNRRPMGWRRGAVAQSGSDLGADRGHCHQRRRLPHRWQRNLQRQRADRLLGLDLRRRAHDAGPAAGHVRLGHER